MPLINDVCINDVCVFMMGVSVRGCAAPGESGVAPREEGVDVKDVFAVKVKRRRSAGQHTGGTLLGITLFRCRRKGLKLKDQAVHLSNMSEDHCEVWFKHLKELLSGTCSGRTLEGVVWGRGSF